MGRNGSKNCKALANLQGKMNYELFEELIQRTWRKNWDRFQIALSFLF